MPHIVIEYSAPIAEQYNLNVVCKMLCEAAVETGVFPKPEDVKVRATPATHWYRPVDDQSFAHVTVRLLSGRCQEQKMQITSALLGVLETQLAEVASLTVDIKDIDRETYAKRSL